MSPLPTHLPSLAFWLLVSFAAGAVGAIASAGSAEFYVELARPIWAPPAWLFGPVWSVLYLLMGIAAWLVWRERRFEGGPLPYALFIAQLVANALWTWLFFEWREGLLAIIDILCLALLIIATLVAFRRIKPLAAWLLAPYLAWVGFATALSVSIVRLNPGAL